VGGVVDKGGVKQGALQGNLASRPYSSPDCLIHRCVQKVNVIPGSKIHWRPFQMKKSVDHHVPCGIVAPWEILSGDLEGQRDFLEHQIPIPNGCHVVEPFSHSLALLQRMIASHPSHAKKGWAQAGKMTVSWLKKTS